MPKPARNFLACLKLPDLRRRSSIPQQRDFSPGVETMPRPAGTSVRRARSQEQTLTWERLVIQPLSPKGGGRCSCVGVPGGGGRGASIPVRVMKGGRRAWPLSCELCREDARPLGRLRGLHPQLPLLFSF